MKKIIILLSILLLSTTASAIPEPDSENPPWYYFVYPELPETGNCNDDIFHDVSPYDGEDDISVSSSGVQVCVNITPPSGCSINISLEYLNYTEYYDDWFDWIDIQSWGEYDEYDDWFDEIDWSNMTDVYNDSYWHQFTSATSIQQPTQICSYNDNVSCYIEDDYSTMYSDWRINWTMNCSGDITTGKCYYYFSPELCPNISYISPPSPNGTVCPCCVEMCIGATNEDGHPMDIKFFAKEQNETDYNNIATFNSKYNGTYCFCFDGYDIQPHAVGHTRAEIIPLAINTWYNITFQYFDSIGMTGTPSEVIIPEDGHYNIDFFAICNDNNANPAGDKIAFRFTRNGAEINSSYHELDFQKQDNLREVVSLSHVILNKGDKINFQYIVNDVNIHIHEDSTWSSNNTSAYASIERVDDHHIPIKYNTTYYWYANITDTETDTSIETDIFQFRTMPNPSFCPCGPEELATIIEDTDTIKDDTWIVGLFIISIGLIFVIKRRN